MEGFQITCGVCHKSNPAEQWIERPSGLKLPTDCFQCPACQVAIKRVLHPPELVTDAPVPWWYGSYIKLERIQPYL